jgi:glycine/D-amino acid oxidase-like deaminating enzyme
VLAVRAHEEERVLDGRTGGGEVEAEQVVVALELDAAELALRLGRAREERDEPVRGAALGAADEEDAGERMRRPLGDEVRLDLGRERRAVDGVARPEAAVLEQQPRLDAARRGAERLGVGARRLGAERPTRPGRGRSPARS